MKIKDALRAKLNVLVVTAVAFAAGLGVAAQLDLTAPSYASGGATPPLQQGSVQLGTDQSVESPTARSLSEDFARVARQVTPAVVTVQVEKQVQGSRMQRQFPFPFNPFGEQPEGESQEPPTRPGTGSGFIIRPSGYIVTNNHVVADAEEITIQLSNRRQIRDVQLVGRDPTTDVALLKVDGEDLPAVSLGSSDSTEVGEWVLAVGNPGIGGPTETLPTTVTAGIVSGKGRNIGVLDRQFRQRGQTVTPAIEDFIQTDAAINPGNSGGPLVNMRGRVIGVNTAIASETGYYMGYGFAVPIELVEEVVQDLMQYGEVRRAALGVTVRDVEPDDAEYYELDRVAGAVVTGFSELEGDVASPAREAGIRSGDVIVSVEGTRLRSVSDLQRRVRAFDPGESVEITVVRRSDRSRETLQVSLGRMGTPSETGRQETREQADGGPLGLEVRSLSPQIRAQLEVPEDIDGVVITGVDRRSPADRAGLDTRFVIVDINGQPVGSVDDYRELASALEPGTVANVRVYIPQAGVERFVSIRIPAS